MILVTGAGGQVGRALIDAARRAGVVCVAFSRDQLDIGDVAAVQRVIDQHAENAAVLVNAAAWTNVDAAEADPDGTFHTNAHGAGVVARACADAGLPIIHLSTDHVFDGAAARAYREDDATRPVNVYGRSKLAGEEAVREATAQHLIVRTSWVFGATGRNFVRTMLDLGARMDTVRVVGDEIGCPTGADDLADALLRLTAQVASGEESAWGTYHLCGTPVISRADFARAIFDVAARAGLPTARVEDTTSAEFGAPAQRPPRVVLDCSRIENVFGIEQPGWMGCVERVVGDRIADSG
jgi:dTDP-4-dehydrorhamnose reductase